MKREGKKSQELLSMQEPLIRPFTHKPGEGRKKRLMKRNQFRGPLSGNRQEAGSDEGAAPAGLRKTTLRNEWDFHSRVKQVFAASSNPQKKQETG